MEIRIKNLGKEEAEEYSRRLKYEEEIKNKNRCFTILFPKIRFCTDLYCVLELESEPCSDFLRFRFFRRVYLRLSLVFFVFSLNRTSIWKAFLWLLILSQILNFTAFYWIPGAISRISGANTFVSILFFFYTD